MVPDARVLLVEPDGERRSLVGEAVGSTYAVEDVATVSALERRFADRAEGSDIDAVLVGDLGPDAVERLVTAIPSHIPVICHPPDGGDRLASDLLGAGAADYVHASVDDAELVSRIRRASDGSTSRVDEWTKDTGEETSAILDRVFETSPVGLFVYDADLNSVRMNQRAEELLEADRETFDERMKDESRMRDLVDDNGNELDRDELPSAVVARTKEPVFGRIIKARDADGAQWLMINAAPVFVDGELSRIVVAVDDITEQRRRAAELEQKNARLERFSDVVSHDLRNPLSVAHGYLKLARETDSPDERQAALDRIERAHERIESLVADLRKLAQSGSEIDEPAPTDIETVARRGWETVDLDDVTLRVEPFDADALSRDGATEILADRDRLQQLFENLFRNVGDRAPSATTVTVRLTDEGFVVEDDGDGFGDIDDPLSPGVSGGDGTGLGLAIVAEIAEAHGWSVDTETAPDGGARFVFTGVEQPS